MHEYSTIEETKIANIQYKLNNALKNNYEYKKLVKGIFEEEANQLIEFVVQKDRTILEKCEGYNLKENSLSGLCGLSQGIVYILLKQCNLEPRVSNLNPTITGESLGGHAFNSVAIPIASENGIEEKNYLIDATFRQFFLRDSFSINGRFIKDKMHGGKVAPTAGYFCMKLPGGNEFANKLLKKGYVELTPENAKIYGDSFMIEQSENKKYEQLYETGITVPVPKKKNLKTKIKGEEYLKNIIDPNRQDQRGIDFDDGELEEAYGKEIVMPLNQRQLEYKEVTFKDNISKEVNKDDKEQMSR